MSIPNKQIGWSNESNLLWQIAKQLERLTGVTSKISGGGGSSATVVTKAQVDALIASSSLVPGSTYIITGVDVPLYGGTTIMLQAETTNKLALAGHGIFYNPKYLNSQLTPGNGYGIWQSTETYFIGNDVIWGGKHWTNTSGNVGTADDKYTLSAADWTVVPFNSTDYNVEIDVIHYDYLHDMIVRRMDRWNNDVKGQYLVFDEFASPNGYGYGNPIKDFQWGNYPDDFNTLDYQYLGVYSNVVKDSYFDCLNFTGNYISENYLDEYSFIINNVWLNNSGAIYSNRLVNNSSIEDNTFGPLYSSIDYNILENSYIRDNVISDGNISVNKCSVGCTISSNTFNGFGAIIYNDLTIFSSIDGNTINSSSRILENVLSNNSNIYANTMNTGSYVIGNNINKSIIQSSTLTNSSRIHYNTLNSSNFNFSSSGTLTTKLIQYIESMNSSLATDISAATIIFGNYAKQMFSNSAGVTKLGYYNASNVFTVVNVNA